MGNQNSGSISGQIELTDHGVWVVQKGVVLDALQHIAQTDRTDEGPLVGDLRLTVLSVKQIHCEKVIRYGE